ncbi:GreA/GreB family elongation factor [Desulfatitalea alkaliphila]|uniref:GreA/GreB family elongation factor n=1 Tax=Desulfatitalea alkaliphila TaxID=2929485 RepID=A0AA41R203_9BACT|nr:GreA/GreB family elongation factor [Desulfatitalea alkaliphila]
MKARKIFITPPDRARVERLMLFCDLFDAAERTNIRRLYYEVSRGRVVRAAQMPDNVVTTNSRIILKEMGSGAALDLVLVFPDDADDALGRVSILAPIGAALFGRQVDDLVECPTRKGVRRYIIQQTTYLPRQPD